MAIEEHNRLIAKHSQPQKKEFCPLCRAHMVEVDRRSEDGVLFVWYECSKNNCDGQWLQKTPEKPHDNSISSEAQ
jgi:hypothetical protein